MIVYLKKGMIYKMKNVINIKYKIIILKKNGMTPKSSEGLYYSI